MLNHLWLAFFLIACLSGLYHWLWLGDSAIFNRLVEELFAKATLGFEIALGLTGLLCFWMGLLRVAEQAGIIGWLARGLSPFFCRLMPDVPKGHMAHGSMTMNIAANMLGLDNAATPSGIKAMEDLQRLNTTPATATNAQILFLVLNTSSVTLLPVTIFMYRAQMGAAHPTDVFIPILFATSASTLAGLLSVAAIQRLPLLNPVILAYLGGFALLISSLALYFAGLTPALQTERSMLMGNLLLFGIIIAFLLAGWVKKVPVYECFIEGAKGGFELAVRLIPYLVAMLVAIGVLRASGALDGLITLLSWGVAALGLDTAFTDALPTGLMKPFSGSGSRALMLETFEYHGVDSFAGKLAAIMQGSTETTFYVLAVYFGAVGITRVRHAITCGLIADLTGIVTAILIGYWFFS